MLTIILGLLGLGVVVLVHELGHYAAARATGIEVETFSIGWGPKIASFRHKGTEWQISAFPVGGYCRMRGEDAFRRAITEKLEHIPEDKGSFYGASPLRRILVALSGPIANIIFATIVFSIVAAVGYTVYTTPAKIILVSELESHSKASNYLNNEKTGDGTGAGDQAAQNAADIAGLQSGDVILSLAGKPVHDYADLQMIVGSNPGKPLSVEFERQGKTYLATITPRLDPETGTGKIGVYSWVEPIISTVTQGSAASIAGLAPLDRIVSFSDKSVQHSMDVYSALSDRPERVKIIYERAGARIDTEAVLSWEGSSERSGLGIGFASIKKVIRTYGATAILQSGFKETASTISMTVKGLGTLFRGTKVFSALSGPARITWMVGRTTTESVKQEGPAGLVHVFNFLAFLSVGLFIMNLLPIPALDGGLILMFIMELVRKKPLKARTIMKFQFAGTAFILALFALATFGDILFFTKM